MQMSTFKLVKKIPFIITEEQAVAENDPFHIKADL